MKYIVRLALGLLVINGVLLSDELSIGKKPVEFNPLT